MPVSRISVDVLCVCLCACVCVCSPSESPRVVISFLSEREMEFSRISIHQSDFVFEYLAILHGVS